MANHTGTNTIYSDENFQGKESENDKEAVIAMLAVFSVVGTLGNALALYVFSKMLSSKQHLTSTMFILTLAATDFITSFLIIPFTMYMEYKEHHVKDEFVCKFYNFLATTTVPYSAFIMVAIAVDRYICIVHPFSQAMTTFRAKLVIGSLACLAITMGVTTSLFYSVYSRTTESLFHSNSSRVFSLSGFVDIANATVNSFEDDESLTNLPVSLNGSYSNIKIKGSYSYPELNLTREEVVFTNLCDRTDYIISLSFQTAFQWFSSSLFLIVLVIVSILYALIYRRVLQRRKAHPHIFSNYWCFCIPKTGLDRNQGIVNENGFEVNNERRSLRSPSIRSPNARADKIFLANLKIAVTLLVVTIVFVAAYLPAWLMALRVVPENVVVFYTYFTHNVVNPLIYAFMNQKFREHLSEIRKCSKNRGS